VACIPSHRPVSLLRSIPPTLELIDSLRVSQLALRVTQKSLLEARQAIRGHEERWQTQAAQLVAFARHVDELVGQISGRMEEIDTRLSKLELRLAAREDFDRIIYAWAVGQTYSNMHWAVQVALLAREVFSSYVVMYELSSNDRQYFRELLVNRVLSESKISTGAWFNLADLLDQAWEIMPDRERNLAAELLEIRSWPLSRLLSVPYLFTMGTTFEMVNIPRELLPPSPAKCALEICRTRISPIANTTDNRDFVKHVVNETAEDCLVIMRDNTL
jgi:hypothetical protein